MAIFRLEQLYPFPADDVAALLGSFPETTDIVWVQEEQRNMGAWGHVRERMTRLIEGRTLRYVGRPSSASTATSDTSA